MFFGAGVYGPFLWPWEVRVKYVALAVFGAVVGFLLMRFLFPVVLDYNVAFLALPILLVATLLLARALRRGRSGS